MNDTNDLWVLLILLAALQLSVFFLFFHWYAECAEAKRRHIILFSLPVFTVIIIAKSVKGIYSYIMTEFKQPIHGLKLFFGGKK